MNQPQSQKIRFRINESIMQRFARLFILAVEVTNISTHGIWLLVRNKEMFIPYEDFPWFRNQPVSAIINVEEQSPGHFYWPDLDVDLTEDIIEHPARFPLKAGRPSS